MRKFGIFAFSICLLLTGCARTPMVETKPVEMPTSSEEETASPVIEWEEEPVEDSNAAPTGGLYAITSIPVPDPEAEEMQWEDMGDYFQSVLWSPDSNYVAIARKTETEVMVTVIEPVKGSYWHMTMPDGSNIPKNAFLPEKDWGQWTDKTTLNIVLGGTKDGQEKTTYRCLINMVDGQLTGSTFEQTSKILPGVYDFDHDGMNEVLELVTVLDPTVEDTVGVYELRISKRDGTLLWMQEASLPHVGWTSIFACEIDGQDYLLRYLPGMWQGWAEYSYSLFSLDGANVGLERVLRESAVVWDDHFTWEDQGHQFNAPALADFLAEVHGYLDGSTLLISTENGTFRTGGRGANFEDRFLAQWQQCKGDITVLEELLLEYEAEAKGEQKVEIIE